MSDPEHSGERPASHGHHYQHVQVSEGARAQLGDTYHIGREDPLSLLPSATNAPFNSYDKRHDPLCLPHTRISVLHEITSWASGQDKRCIFWLNGAAGTGKSTIARTIARKYYDEDQLGASFFFSRGGGDVSHAGKFFTSIASQLAHRSSILKGHICEAIAKDRDIASKGLRDQWTCLILQPLSQLEAKSLRPPFLIMIDALDECDEDNDVRAMLQCLVDLDDLESTRLRICITSRPETPIRLGFSAMPGAIYHDLILHDIPRIIVDHDILVFFKEEFKGLRDSLGDVAADWPGNENIKLLVQKAEGLFIYAATICRFIKGDNEWPPQDLLNIFLLSAGLGPQHELESSIPFTPPTWELDQIYTQILQYSFRNLQHKDKVTELFKQVVGSVAIVSEPLSALALARLLGHPIERVNQRLRHLHSVLNVPRDQGSLIRLHHSSFRDFLLDQGRCGDFWVDEKQAHQTLATSCIQLMSKTLKKNICEIHTPGSLATQVKSSCVKKFIPLEVQYACLYWIQHLQRSSAELYNNSQVYRFLREHLLHWLEALSWIGKTSEGIIAILSLEALIPVDKSHDLYDLIHNAKRWLYQRIHNRVNKSPNLYEFVYDAKRFALHNRRVIEQAPLQLYCSALVFAPVNSIIRRQFEKCIPDWIQTRPRVYENWNAALQALEGHSGSVNSVAFSPDGKLVVSGSNDKTVRLWDAATGAARQALKGHPNCVNSVAFSPDGKLVVSGSDDKTVRLWDAATGAARQTLKGHSGSVNSVAFSPDGKFMVSGSYDTTVLLWDAATGAARRTLKGHSSLVNSVAFSPDGKLVVSGSNDKTVRLWNAAIGAARRTLKGHSGWVNSVAFSPDGKLVVSGSYDTTVRLWDAVVGAARQTLKGHSSSVNSVAFSPDGKLVVSGSYDTTVRLWDAATGAARQTLKGHPNWVNSVTFSPDSKLVVSGSDDKTVRLWDAAIGAARQTLKGHLDCVNSVAFSPDGKLVVSGSDDKTVRLWDAATGAARQTLKGHSGLVNSVAFSPDGKQVISGSYDQTVRLWDAATGAALQTLKGHSDRVYSVAFSPDGKQVVSGSYDQTARLWDAATGAALQTLKGHSSWVISVAFSPDGKQVISGLGDQTVRLWDAATGAALQRLKGHSGRVYSVAFSPNGKQVISGSGDQTVRLWDAATGAALQTLKGHSSSVISVAFSPDGKQVISGSGDQIVRLWDAATGAALQTLKGHSDSVYSVAFSPDGKAANTPLLVSNDWIVEKNEKILWLPPDYRSPSCIAVWNRNLVLGYQSGQLSLLGFQNGLKVL